jgi:CheY-like chemotaxis protein
VQDALDAGMDAHVAKPIDMEILKTALSQTLKGIV